MTRISLQGNNNVHAERFWTNLQSFNGVLSYPGWEYDFKEAEEYYKRGDMSNTNRLMKKFKKKQKVLVDGDRSHPRLVALDALGELTYPGWEVDVYDTERIHFDYDTDTMFREKLCGLKNKQLQHDGDRSHPYLKKLDAIKAKGVLKYPGHEDDLRDCEEAHLNGDVSGYDRIWCKMNKKYRVLDLGDRSHKELRALDELKLSYEGWEDDVVDAERLHFEYGRILFSEKIRCMKNKQLVHTGDRSHPNLVKIDQLKQTLTYPSFLDDLERAEGEHVRGNLHCFRRLMDMCEKKQIVLVDNDRSHPNLKALDAITCSPDFIKYPGYEQDIHEAQEKHYQFGSYSDHVFNEKLQSIKNKQLILHSRARHDNDHGDSDGDSQQNNDSNDSHVGNSSSSNNNGNTVEAISTTTQNSYISNPNSDANNKKNVWKKIKGTIMKIRYNHQKEQEQQQPEQENNPIIQNNQHSNDPASMAPTPVIRSNDAKEKEEMTSLPVAGAILSSSTATATVKANIKKSKKDINQRLKESSCIICKHNAKSHIFTPCGHICTCENCAIQCIDKNISCPICHMVTFKAYKIFVV